MIDWNMLVHVRECRLHENLYVDKLMVKKPQNI